MLKREKILKILTNAAKIDSRYELFGTDKHKYILNAPINAAAVRKIEEKYGFTLPDDYFQFITETGDGGAGPDYGIYSVIEFIKPGRDEYAEKYLEEYRQSVSKLFAPRPMTNDDVENYAVAKEAFQNNPSKFFVFAQYCEEDGENEPCMNGFFTIGTHGCQYDFGIILTGKFRGQVFSTDNEGAYIFLATSFTEFYLQWLDRISDTEALEKELKSRRNIFGRKK